MKDGIEIKRAIKKKRPGVAAGIIAGAVVVVLAAGTAGAGFYINNLKTVYPNVSFCGVKLSGMTLDEAKKALTDAGYDKAGANIGVTVSFPDGEQMTISGDDAGVRLQADQAAQIAYDYGKDGSFFAKELAYAKNLFSAHNLDGTGATKLNESYVRGVVEDSTKKFNEKIMKDAYTITDTSIEIVKGSGTTMADAGELYNLVVDALSKSVAQNKPVTVDYSVGTDGGDGIDLQKIYNTIHTEPVDAVYDKATSKATQSVIGVSFDVKAAQKKLDEAKTGATITIPLVRTEPKVSTEQLQGTLFRDVLSEKKTYVSGTSNRLHNVALAAKAVNGTILNPGDTFSYNGTLGQRTEEKGYKEAGAYSSGQVVQEIGGGICQVSSTLYYCTLYANLEIVERSNHMFVVAYLPLGDDATVNWGTVDFKFKNNTAYPIRIESIYKDGYLTVRLYGTKTDTNRVDVQYNVVKKTDFKTVTKEDPSVEAGKTKVSQSGCAGYVVDTYKYIYDAAGNLVSKTFIARSSYKPEDKIILVPVGTLTTPSPSGTPSPSSSDELVDPEELPPSTSDAPAQ